MSKTQSEALRLANIFDHPLPPEWSDMVAAAATLRRLEAENKALLDALEAVEMSAVDVGGGESVVSNRTIAKVESILKTIRAAQGA